MTADEFCLSSLMTLLLKILLNLLGKYDTDRVLCSYLHQHHVLPVSQIPDFS